MTPARGAIQLVWLRIRAWSGPRGIPFRYLRNTQPKTSNCSDLSEPIACFTKTRAKNVCEIRVDDAIFEMEA